MENKLMYIISKTGKENYTFTARTCQKNSAKPGEPSIDYHQFSSLLDQLASLGFIKRIGIDSNSMVEYSLYK